ncbi:RNA-dependent RNA polymerase P1-P2 fusion protein [Cereal yellow dwarf virus RPS]|uniref:RNA-dependent RNA polymerase P1-P2 fusion protein n=1 Tax=Cereal yellow dwarf virus RPS TaxID=228582 RepID=UPI0002B3FE2D|nr:RNA-dependent RNA polymerase P1-P2 fusion protein [Cereal yellow dwarf virus RPS]
MGPKKLSFSVFLWLMCFLSFSQGNHTGMATGSDFPSPTTLIYSGGVWPLVTPHSSPVAGEKCTLTCAPCPVRSITEPSYKELLQQLWVKAWLDSRALCFTAIDSSSRFLSHAYELSSATARALFGQVLWFAVYLWTNVLLQTARIVCSVVASYYLQVASLISLGITTSWIYKILRWTFGTLPASLCIRLGKSICRVLTCRKFFNEKSVAGFDSYSIPQSPPKKSVITLRRADKTHVGFAVCIRLFNNSNALVTSEHNLREADAFYSPRTGRAIKLAEFKVIFKDADLDVAIVAGPDNWESAFGCGSVHFTTHDRLAKCPAQIYVIDGEDWRAHSAKVVGHFDNFAQVLSNTKPGFSGAGYFHGKTLLGVHKGHAGKDYNFNLMAPLPAIPGLTSPKYEIESDPPQGLIFPSEVAEEITKTIQSVYNDFLKLDKSIHSKGKEWKGGVAWADLEDESGKSGNRQGGRVRRTNRSTKSQGRYKRNKESCCTFFAEGTAAPRCIPTHTHNLDDNPMFSRCYCNIPGHKCPFWDVSARRDAELNEFARTEDRHVEDREIDNRSGRCTSSEETSRQARLQQETRAWQQYFADVYTWEISTSEQEVPGFQRVGKLSPQYYPRARSTTAWGERLCAEHPLLGEKTKGFGWPAVGATAELTSLRLQAARWLERSESAKIPSDAARKNVIDRTVQAYSNCKTNVPRCTRDQLNWDDFRIDFLEAIKSLQLDAGVGIPMITAGLPTHRGWVEDPDLLPVLARLTFDRLLTMSKASLETRSPEQLVKENLCDPIRLFVKQEPHKQSKLDEGRYRLIMSVSLIDQLVARVLFQAQNKSEIALWSAIPSKPGFGLSTEDQVESFINVLADTAGARPEEICDKWRDLLVPTDCSGFDWSVSDWMLADDMEVRNRLTIDCNELTRHLRAVWLQGISNSVLCLSDGTMLSQVKPGVQKSGSYNTSSTNSRIRVMAAYHCGASWAIAMGDDALEAPDTDLSKYKDLGFKVEVSKELEFCSHIFKSPTLAIPVNANKMLYRLIHGYNPECGNAEVIVNYLNAASSVLHELRHDQELCALLHMWLVSGITTKDN